MKTFLLFSILLMLLYTNVLAQKGDPRSWYFEKQESVQQQVWPLTQLFLHYFSLYFTIKSKVKLQIVIDVKKPNLFETIVSMWNVLSSQYFWQSKTKMIKLSWWLHLLPDLTTSRKMKLKTKLSFLAPRGSQSCPSFPMLIMARLCHSSPTKIPSAYLSSEIWCRFVIEFSSVLTNCLSDHLCFL